MTRIVVPFHLWWREIMLKREKSGNTLLKVVWKNFSFTSLEMYGNPIFRKMKIDQFLVEKSKTYWQILTLKSEWVLWNTKFYRKYKFQQACAEVEMCFLRWYWTNVVDKSTKWSFSMECFTANFWNLSSVF